MAHRLMPIFDAHAHIKQGGNGTPGKVLVGVVVPLIGLLPVVMPYPGLLAGAGSFSPCLQLSLQ